MEGKLGIKGRGKIQFKEKKYPSFNFFFLWNYVRILLKLLNSSGYCVSEKYMSRSSHCKSAVSMTDNFKYKS